MPQNIQNAIHIAGIIERYTELADRIDCVHIDKALPGFGLGVLNEANECIRI